MNTLQQIFHTTNSTSSNDQISEKLHNLTDQNLYYLCKTYGARALEWRRKFIGLLPEVNRRKLYEKKGFDSIFVFAYKLAGLSEKQVKLAINMEEKFAEMPKLESLLVDGKVSINKLARIASIANSENQEFLATQVQILSQGAVETLVKNAKMMTVEQTECLNLSSNNENQNGLFEPETANKSLRTQRLISLNHTLNISPEVHQKLLELQQKGLDINRIILDFLQKREEEIAQKKEQISQKVLQKEEKKAQQITIKSHYICQDTKKILHEEFGTKCSIKNCQKSATTIHHTQRFSLDQSHNPHFLAPLCKEHHEIAHACDVKYQEIKLRVKNL